MSSRPALHIIKVGGRILADADRCDAFYADFVRLASPKILVHGGGDQANAWLEKLQIVPQKINGRRITDAQTLEVITMVYAGMNKEIVAQLNARGARTIGLCGSDALIIQAHKRIVQDIDYGFAGDIDTVDAEAIQSLLSVGHDLVFSPLTFQSDGLLLNTNADTIATRLALALSEAFTVDLQLISDVPGVLKDPTEPASRIEQINEKTYTIFKDSGIISGGMIPKMDNALKGLKQGIACIYISDRIITGDDTSSGTKIIL